MNKKSAKRRRKPKAKRLHSHCIHVQRLAEIGIVIQDKWPGVIGVAAQHKMTLAQLTCIILESCDVQDRLLLERIETLIQQTRIGGRRNA